MAVKQGLLVFYEPSSILIHKDFTEINPQGCVSRDIIYIIYGDPVYLYHVYKIYRNEEHTAQSILDRIRLLETPPVQPEISFTYDPCKIGIEHKDLQIYWNKIGGMYANEETLCVRYYAIHENTIIGSMYLHYDNHWLAMTVDLVHITRDTHFINGCYALFGLINYAWLHNNKMPVYFNNEMNAIHYSMRQFLNINPTNTNQIQW